MDQYCEQFKGGLCERCNKHVPRSWCLDRCKGDPKNIQPAEQKLVEKPTLVQMADHFVKAMAKWAKSGLKTVDQNEYNRRRMICNDCSGGWRCPKCGCALWAKSALATEECEKWK